MALYTSLSLDEARAIGAAYQLRVTSIEPLIAGSVNSNFAIETADESGGVHKMFLRIYEEQDAAGARDEAALLDWLDARGVPVSPPLRRADDRDAISVFGQRAVAIFPWIPGDIRCTAGVTRDDAAIVGETLARIHLAGMPSPRESRFSLDRLVARCDQIDGADDPELRAMAPRLRDLLGEVRRSRNEGCARGLCHGDMFRDNVLWSKGQIAAVLDFESAASDTLMFDLATTMMAWCFGDDFSPDLVAAMGRGYASVRTLTAEDREGICAEARLAALRFTTTRITDYAMRAGTGKNVLRDWRRFWRRYERVTDLGSRGLVEMLGIA